MKLGTSSKILIVVVGSCIVITILVLILRFSIQKPLTNPLKSELTTIGVSLELYLRGELDKTTEGKWPQSIESLFPDYFSDSKILTDKYGKKYLYTPLKDLDRIPKSFKPDNARILVGFNDVDKANGNFRWILTVQIEEDAEGKYQIVGFNVYRVMNSEFFEILSLMLSIRYRALYTTKSLETIQEQVKHR